MRLGLDLGGTKTEVIALDPAGGEILRHRIPSPQGDYQATIAAVTDLVRQAEQQTGRRGTVGIGIPGTISAATGLVKNANSTWLIGKPLARDLSTALDREIRLANDANCFALSEAGDGTGAGAHVVFGVILGTGVGGGVVVAGNLLDGAHGIAGEWGHNPLPAMTPEECKQAPACYCGKRGCIETWCSGIGLAADFQRHPLRSSLARGPATTTSPTSASRAGEVRLSWTAKDIAASNDADAIAAVTRFIDRLARSLASIVNILDPDAIVLGGGLSNIDRLYRELPLLVENYAFTPEGRARIVKNRHGDSSGVRGAAWLWPA